ncbi:FAD-binding oxidoreductase [Ahniella affigens]|uniref:FAD-binding oxidoreductase n=1 Tax=Ahniella affigens TaxID=2021234 RepID=A0A2P1PMR4_9GAMM|nr:FAD-binding oxidoreductase [Ahniella affigens]AVP96119.1 FAD-binding oxidoreductase [Ahniella affigens]
MNRRELVKALSLLPFSGSAAALAPLLAESADLRLIVPSDADYATRRGGFNQRIVRKPAVLALCRSMTGIQRALAFAAESNLKVGIRSGGHCFEGHGLIENGLLLDLSALNTLKRQGDLVDIGPGAKLGGVYQQLAAENRLLPAGSCAGVGVAGLALGGGYGFFARQHGLTSDHLVELDLIDAGGKLHTVRDDDPLLMACRGGGNGQFGAVSRLRFRTHPAPSRFASHRFRFRELTVARAKALAERWCDLVERLPLTSYASFVLNGRTLTVLITDSAAKAPTGFADQLARFGADATETPPVREDLFLAGIQRFSGGTTPMYFKNFSAGYYADWADLARGFEALAALVIEQKPNSILQINSLAGAISTNTVPSAYAHRRMKYLGEFQVYYNSPKQAEPALALTERARQVIEAHWSRHYANYPNDAFQDATRAYYGAQLPRLQQLKRDLDPDRRFAEFSAV